MVIDIYMTLIHFGVHIRILPDRTLVALPCRRLGGLEPWNRRQALARALAECLRHRCARPPPARTQPVWTSSRPRSQPPRCPQRNRQQLRPTRHDRRRRSRCTCLWPRATAHRARPAAKSPPSSRLRALLRIPVLLPPSFTLALRAARRMRSFFPTDSRFVEHQQAKPEIRSRRRSGYQASGDVNPSTVDFTDRGLQRSLLTAQEDLPA